VELHGHGGPFMVIGLRMGLLALRTLDSPGWFNLNCIARLNLSPPDSCVIDGLQSSTGCTLGKRNIEVEEGEGVASEFRFGSRVLRLSLKPDILSKIRNDPASDHWIESGDEYEEDSIMDKLIKARDETLFDISIATGLDG
jgi:formylmethanofuran dehydrogenase subunit E